MFALEKKKLVLETNQIRSEQVKLCSVMCYCIVTCMLSSRCACILCVCVCVCVSVSVSMSVCLCVCVSVSVSVSVCI